MKIIFVLQKLLLCVGGSRLFCCHCCCRSFFCYPIPIHVWRCGLRCNNPTSSPQYSTASSKSITHLHNKRRKTQQTTYKIQINPHLSQVINSHSCRQHTWSHRLCLAPHAFTQIPPQSTFSSTPWLFLLQSHTTKNHRRPKTLQSIQQQHTNSFWHTNTHIYILNKQTKQQQKQTKIFYFNKSHFAIKQKSTIFWSFHKQRYH